MTERVYTTEKGKSELSFLNEPSYKYKPEGLFSTKLVLSEEDAKVDIDRIQEVFQKKYDEIEKEINEKTKGSMPRKTPKVADMPYADSFDEEGNKLGVKFNFSQKHKVPNKKTGKVMKFTPKIYNAKGQEVSPAVYNGSTIRVAYTIYPWYTAALGVGISLRLKGTKVYELVTGSSEGVSAFQNEEEGWDEQPQGTVEEEFGANEDDEGDEDDPEI